MPRTHTDARGMTRTFTYDALNRLTRIDYPDSTYIQYGYTNGAGTKLLDLTYMKDRMGGQTYYLYDGLRRKIQEKDPRGNTTGFGYCSCGALEYVTNALSQVTHYSYDLQGHRVAIDYPNSTHTTNSFDLLGRLVLMSDALGKTTNTYDNLSRLIKVADAGGQKFAAVYDVEDRPTSVTDDNGVAVSRTFDDLGRVRTRTYPDSGVERFGYSALGLVKYTNQLNFITSYGYDAALRKTFETNANSEVLQFTYNAADDLRTLTDGKSQVTKWGYDLYGRVTSKTNQANSQILTYAYDANNRLTNRWSSAKGNTKYTYDANGNVTFVDHPSSTDITYSYDGLNRLTNMVDAAGTTAFTYNSAGDLLTEDSPWASDVITYGYDSSVPHLRKSLSLQQPSGSWTNGFSYDGAHRLSSVTSQAGTYTYTYYTGSGGAASSRLYRKLALPNTSYITNAFDSVARLTDTWLKNSGNTILNQHSYLNNAGNQRYKQTRTDASYVNYTYDNIGQLRSALGYTSGGTPISTEQKGYTYDAAWNLSARTNNGTTSTLTLDSQNQISSGLGSTFTWDSNGNRSTRSDNGTARYTYDDENQLVEVDKDPATYSLPPRTDYVYDGLGRMRKRTEYQWNGSIWNLQSETRYIYMGNLVIQERDSSNNPNVAYTRGNDLSGTFEGAGGIGSLLGRSSGYSAGSWSTHHHYHSDGGGNITALVDSSQSISANYRYDSYGNLLSSSGTMAAPNLYRFSSKQFQTNSVLYYYGFRFYDPLAQRWLNRDPLYDLGSDLLGRRRQHSEQSNLYLFVDNDPISKFDSYGLLLGTLLDGIQNFACPHLSGSSCSVCCALAFQAALVADGLEGGAIISGGIVIGPITVGAGTAGAVAIGLGDIALSHANDIKAFNDCLDSCKKSDCNSK